MTPPGSGSAWPSNEDLTKPGFELRFDGTVGLQSRRSESLPSFASFKLASPRLRVTQQPLSDYQRHDPYKAPTPPEKQWLPPWHTTETWARYTTPTWKRRAEFPGELISGVGIQKEHRKALARDKHGYHKHIHLR